MSSRSSRHKGESGSEVDQVTSDADKGNVGVDISVLSAMPALCLVRRQDLRLTPSATRVLDISTMFLNLNLGEHPTGCDIKMAF